MTHPYRVTVEAIGEDRSSCAHQLRVVASKIAAHDAHGWVTGNVCGSAVASRVVVSASESKCQHRPRTMDYNAAVADARERMLRGERQRLCQVCLRWFWEAEFENLTPASTAETAAADTATLATTTNNPARPVAGARAGNQPYESIPLRRTASEGKP